jgi:hypothetical protein
MEEEEGEGSARLVEPAVSSPVIRVQAGFTLAVLSCTVRYRTYLRHSILFSLFCLPKKSRVRPENAFAKFLAEEYQLLDLVYQIYRISSPLEVIFQDPWIRN